MKKFSLITVFLIALMTIIIACERGGKPVSSMEKISIESFYISDENINKFDSIRISVILPPSYKKTIKKYPTLYFLPGYNQSDSVIYDLKIDSLLNRTFVNRTLKEFIFITYDNQNNNYNNWSGTGQLWSDFISTSLIELIDSKYRTFEKSDKRGLYGVSMGGEGALLNGLRNPDKFEIIMSHSASIHYPQIDKVFDWSKPFLESYFSPIYGAPLTQKRWQANNVIWFVENNEIASSQKIYFDVGIKDHLQFHTTNILLDEKLNNKLIPHTFRLTEGGHGNKQYIQNMPIALEFWDNAIKIEPIEDITSANKE